MLNALDSTEAKCFFNGESAGKTFGGLVKLPCWIVLCFFLMISTSAMAEGTQTPILSASWNLKKRDSRPYHYAVVMPAEGAKDIEDSPEAYEGVEFPLFCGVASVYPREKRFVFTKTTNLPIEYIMKRLGQVEKSGIIEFSGYPNLQLAVDDEDFLGGFIHWAELWWIAVFYIDTSDEIPLDMIPKFTRTCPYDSKKEPPVECGYSVWDINDLRIPYAWEIEARKERELKRQTGQKQ